MVAIIDNTEVVISTERKFLGVGTTRKVLGNIGKNKLPPLMRVGQSPATRSGAPSSGWRKDGRSLGRAAAASDEACSLAMRVRRDDSVYMIFHGDRSSCELGASVDLKLHPRAVYQISRKEYPVALDVKRHRALR